MQGQKQKMATGSKRKPEDDNGRTPRKKVQTENPHAAERPQTKYRAPKGIRKSARIAGKPADPPHPRPRGQYDREEEISDGSAGSELDIHSASAEDTPSRSTEMILSHITMTLALHKVNRGASKKFWCLL